MFWTIKDIQKFLLSKQIFWDGRVYGRNGFEEASEKSFQPHYGEVDCKMTFLNEEKTVERDVVLDVNDYKLEIRKDSKHYKVPFSKTLYDFSMDWCKYRLGNIEFAKALVEEGKNNVNFWRNNGQEEIKKHKEAISKIEEENAKEISYWSDLTSKALNAVKKYEKKKPIDTM